ncbi:Lysophospholipase 1 [Sphaceloma murrayae]|uniref:Lysophospholipase n=1 Tax=Sphaceloma murrayae TaxID=2082308 RepID=A0A2K1R394_9PEZI|nr:Lysophospholipase 1 [Sphaceloma murrayae]
MWLYSVAALALAAVPSISASAVDYSITSRDRALPNALVQRALPDAPNGYTPTAEACPSNRPVIRNAATLSVNETDWLEIRRPQAIRAMRTLLAQVNITGLDTNAYIDNNANNVSQLPNIGIALSGGGYRALLTGAGVLSAFDDRTRHNSTSAGSLAGLLQSTTYLAGLSGGSWAVGSLYINNFTSVQDILDRNQNVSGSGSLWKFENSVFEGPDTGAIQLLSTASYYQTLVDQVSGKSDAGYNTTVTDYWGRGLSFQLINASAGGPEYTFSSIARQSWFTSGAAPMPLIVADARSPGEFIISTNSTVYEFNPWEMGTWDPTTFAFAPLRYLGSNFTAGSIPDDQQCVRGFDSAGYVMGTSSSLFNQILLAINSSGAANPILAGAVGTAFNAISAGDEDIADYPNPFIAFNNDTSEIAADEQLTLVDGGSDLQNIPFYPLIQPERNVDVIFAVDSSADTNASSPAPNWPNGTSLVATYQRQFLPIGNGTVFPSVPDQETFVNLGLNNRPTFFGCDASNLTGQAPLIVYIPNAPYVYNANVSTFTPSYNDSERNAIIQNGYNVATQGNGTIDPQWPTCVGCAILSRSLNRTGTTVPQVCTDCFARYCWDGRRDSTYRDYIPTSKLEQVSVTSAGTVERRISLAVLLAGIVGTVMVI